MAKVSEIELDVVADFKKKMAVKDIATKYKIKTGTVYYILRKNDIQVVENSTIEDTFMEQLSLESAKGATLSQLSEKYGINTTRLCRLLNSYNISDTVKQTIINLRQAGYNPSKIAQRLSLTTIVVKDVLRSFNIQQTLKGTGLSRKEILDARAKLERS
ncbi:MAG TPA: hypothetical protein EYP60_04390 [bacterium (Candidatus Stahlbacteria)]|nr:hypothetical protein [Candidatus Stahlbacteria bacterium]